MVASLTLHSVITEEDKLRVHSEFERRGIRWKWDRPSKTSMAFGERWDLAGRHQFLADRYATVLRALDLAKRGLPNPHLGKWIVRPRSNAHPNPANENGGSPLTVAELLQNLF